MKIRSVVFTLTLLAAFSAASVLAQGGFTLNWFTVDGGGGRSTGGGFAVEGAIGQPDASATTMTGGGYTVVGGFYSEIDER